jgi:hypothetical protein
MRRTTSAGVPGRPRVRLCDQRCASRPDIVATSCSSASTSSRRCMGASISPSISPSINFSIEPMAASKILRWQCRSWIISAAPASFPNPSAARWPRQFPGLAPDTDGRRQPLPPPPRATPVAHRCYGCARPRCGSGRILDRAFHQSLNGIPCVHSAGTPHPGCPHSIFAVAAIISSTRSRPAMTVQILSFTAEVSSLHTAVSNRLPIILLIS